MPPDYIGRNLTRGALGFAGVLLLAFLAMQAVHWRASTALEHEASQTSEPVVDVIQVQGAGGQGSLTLPGETAAWYESTIYAQVSGYVGKWNVDIGDHVKAGQVLALIETPELDAELAAAKAKLQAARAQVRVKESAADFARSTYARWRDSPKGVVSEQEREDKKAGNDSARAELEAARADVSLDEADVNRLSALEEFKRVVAPYNGTVTERHIDIGNLVTAGSSSSSTSLYRIVQDDPLRVFVDVPQSVSGDLMKVGVPAEISISGSDSTVHGAITRTSDAIDPKARTFRAELDIPNPDRRMVAGAYVQVAFLLPNNGACQIPAAALAFRGSQPEVAIVGSDGAVHFHVVAIERDDGDTIELNSGVAKGDQVVLNISNAIADGQKVQVTTADTPPVEKARTPTLAMQTRQ